MGFGALIPVVAILASACVVIALLHFSHERAKLKQRISGSRRKRAKRSLPEKMIG